MRSACRRACRSCAYCAACDSTATCSDALALDAASECHDRIIGVDSRNRAVSVSASCEDLLASVTATVACTAAGDGDDGCDGVCSNGGDWSVDEELGDVVTVDVAGAADVKASSGGGEGEGAGTIVTTLTRK